MAEAAPRGPAVTLRAVFFMALPFFLLATPWLISIWRRAPAPPKCSGDRPCAECVKTFERIRRRPSAPA